MLVDLSMTGYDLEWVFFQMLSESIMHDCIVRLLRSSSDEESIECFCKLIVTTGKDLDHPKGKVLHRTTNIYLVMINTPLATNG